MTKKLTQLTIAMVLFCLNACVWLHAETQPNSDQGCLAEAIYREAGNQPLAGQYAVGEVIINRVTVGVAPTACAVINQHVGKHWQFGYHTFGPLPIPSARVEYFHKVAQTVLDRADEVRLPLEVMYFNFKPMDPKVYELYCTIGHQYFYKRKGQKIIGKKLYYNHAGVQRPVTLGSEPPLIGSHDVLVHQNTVAKEEGLRAIHDDKELLHLVQSGDLVSIPTNDTLHVQAKLPLNRRYCRFWTANFLQHLSTAYYLQFHQPIVVDSAVRTEVFQQKLRRINSNAAAVSGEAASPHLTGIAVDLSKSHMSAKQLDWMRNYLFELALTGKIDVEEEFHQSCFHISVYVQYEMLIPFKNLIASN